MGSSKQRISQIDKGSLKRVLNVWDLFSVGYGDLGSSIYYALGITTLYALSAAPIALILAGLVFACTALSYAELSSMHSGSGGSATFTRHAFNDLASFIAGWALLLDFIVTIAISSFSIGAYLSFFASSLSQPSNKLILSTVIIFFLFLLNFFGTKGSAKFSWILTTLTLVTQIIIIVIGAIFLLKVPDLIKHFQINVKGVSWSPTWGEFWKGCAMAMVAYTGIESMAQLSGEAKSPAKTVPKAMMLAMFILILIYIGMSSIALSALSPQELSTKYLDNPISGIVMALPFGGKILAGWVGVLATIILFVASNAGLMGASRLLFFMGENYQFPRTVYKIHKKYRTPYVSLAIFAVLSILTILASRGHLMFLADLYNFGAMLAFFMTHLSLIILRIKKPDKYRPFKAPINIRIKNIQLPIPAILGAITTLSTWILVIIDKPYGRNLGLIWIFLGLVIYFFYRKKQKISPMAKVEIEKIQVPEFRTYKYKKILVPVRGFRATETLQISCELAKLHKAALYVVHIIEVPFSMPLEVRFPIRMTKAEYILKRAEAIGREHDLSMKLQVIKARSLDKAILDLIDKESFDLVIMGMTKSKAGNTTGYSSSVEKILKEASCPVLLCSSESPFSKITSKN